MFLKLNVDASPIRLLEHSTTLSIYVGITSIMFEELLYFFCMHNGIKFVLSDLSLLRMLSLSGGLVGGIEWLHSGHSSLDILADVIGVP